MHKIPDLRVHARGQWFHEFSDSKKVLHFLSNYLLLTRYTAPKDSIVRGRISPFVAPGVGYPLDYQMPHTCFAFYVLQEIQNLGSNVSTSIAVTCHNHCAAAAVSLPLSSAVEPLSYIF